jgi:hypothetical protein
VVLSSIYGRMNVQGQPHIHFGYSQHIDKDPLLGDCFGEVHRSVFTLACYYFVCQHCGLQSVLILVTAWNLDLTGNEVLSAHGKM